MNSPHPPKSVQSTMATSGQQYRFYRRQVVETVFVFDSSNFPWDYYFENYNNKNTKTTSVLLLFAT